MEESKHLPLFVYGTLLPNQPNYFLWGSDIVAMALATFPGGRLYDMGYYPMLVTAVSDEDETVQGMVITVDPAQYEAVLQRLDELEGFDAENPEESEYQRQVVEVILSDGRSQSAWVYLGDAVHVQGKPAVTGGDWAAYAANHQPDLQAWWDTISTVAGLHKKE